MFRFGLWIVVLLLFSSHTTIAQEPVKSADEAKKAFIDNEKKIENYVENLKTIIITANGLDRDWYPHYSRFDSNIRIKKELDDYNYRLSSDQFSKVFFPEDKSGDIKALNLEEKMVHAITSRLPSSITSNYKFIAKKNYEQSLGFVDLADKLIINVHAGHSIAVKDNQEKIELGALSVSFNDQYSAFKYLNTRFFPEPFLIAGQGEGAVNLDTAIDFLSIQISEYLKFLLFAYKQPEESVD